MGMTIPPMALTAKQFKKRIKYLKEKGLPLDVENIDPVFYKWYKKEMRFLDFRMVTLFVIGMTFLGVFLFIWAMRLWHEVL